MSNLKVFTVGHFTHGIEESLAFLEANQITFLVDVRTVPKSRHNPQFTQTELVHSPSKVGLGYRHDQARGVAERCGLLSFQRRDHER